MDCIRALELLIKSHYPIVYFETVERGRVESIIDSVANNMGLLFFIWTATEGLEPVFLRILWFCGNLKMWPKAWLVRKARSLFLPQK